GHPGSPVPRTTLCCSPGRAAVQLALATCARAQTVLADYPRPVCAARRLTRGWRCLGSCLLRQFWHAAHGLLGTPGFSPMQRKQDDADNEKDQSTASCEERVQAMHFVETAPAFIGEQPPPEEQAQADGRKEECNGGISHYRFSNV